MGHPPREPSLFDQFGGSEDLGRADGSSDGAQPPAGEGEASAPPPGPSGPDMWAISAAPPPPLHVPAAPPEAPPVPAPEKPAAVAARRPLRFALAIGAALVLGAVAIGHFWKSRTSSAPGTPPVREGSIATTSPPSHAPVEPAPTGMSVGDPDGKPEPDSPTSAFAILTPPQRADWQIVVGGKDAEGLADASRRILDSRSPERRKGPLLHFVAQPAAVKGSGLSLGNVLIESSGAGLRLGYAPRAADTDNDRADAIVPVRFSGEVLLDLQLPMRPDAKAGAAVALTLLLAEEPNAASETLALLPDDPGIRVLKAYAAVGLGDFPSAHKALLGLANDPDLGAVAHFLTGAALFGDGNTRESLRDFEAAAKQRENFWPVLLFQAAANHRLELYEEALAGYEAVLSLAPGRPEAVIGRASLIARKDRPAGLALYYGLVHERPRLAGVWLRIADLREQGKTEEDAFAVIDALQQVTSLRPRNREAWRRLGAVEWRLGGRGGGPEAFRAASEAYATEAKLSTGPEAALATFNRGAVLHQWAMLPPPDLNVREARARLKEAVGFYAEALAKGLSHEMSARAQFNRGLALDLIAASEGGGAGAPPAASPPDVIAAFEAAVAEDATYASAPLALVGVKLASGDVAAARAAIAALPTGTPADGRDLLTAAADGMRSDLAKVRDYFSRSKPALAADADPISALAMRLADAGYGRVARVLLGAEPSDVSRLAARVHADAMLWDAASSKADLARLERLDAAAASALRSGDAVLVAVLRD